MCECRGEGALYLCMYARACAHPHVWMAEDLVNLLLYHCLLYFLETKSLTEPIARLAASKPRRWLTKARSQASLSDLSGSRRGKEKYRWCTLPWKSSLPCPPWHCRQRLLVHVPAIQTWIISQNYINYNSLGIILASAYILN